MSCISIKHIFFCTVSYKKQNKQTKNFSPSNIPFKSCNGPARAILINRHANRKTVKQSHYTCLTVLEVQNCKSTIQSALVFLSKYIKKSTSHSLTQKNLTVLRQYQFQLLFGQEFKKGKETIGSDWHTGCYNQPTLSVTDGK